MIKFTKLILPVFVLLTFGCQPDRQSSESNERENLGSRPNIILIMADDLGYETLSCNGGESYHTPRLDQLANEGIRFTRAYATPLCTPSRVQIMTGKYNFRNYQRFGYLDSAELTFANYIQDAGYKTAIAGKWQLEGDADSPNDFGFNNYCLWQLNRGDFWRRYKNPIVIKDGIKSTDKDMVNQYGPQVFTDYILNFISKNQENPFFVYYPMALVHDPFQPTPDHPNYDDFPIEGLNDTTYFRNMMSQMDTQVGRIYDHLNELDLLQNTIILFTGDNGTDRKVISKFDGAQIKGNKGYTTDAGTHVPMIVYAKKHIMPSSIYQGLVDFTDILPTLLTIANIPLTNVPTDGYSFWENLVGRNKNIPRDHVFCSYSPRWAKFTDNIYVQDTTYKLYSDGRFYNYISDINEQFSLHIDSLSFVQKQHFEHLQKNLQNYLPEAQDFLSRP